VDVQEFVRKSLGQLACVTGNHGLDAGIIGASPERWIIGRAQGCQGKREGT